MQERICRLRHLIRANYWFDDNGVPEDANHKVLYEKGLNAASHAAGRHWMASFAPSGYSYRFDAFANILASLLDVADAAQCATVDAYIRDELLDPELPLLPAFHPVIRPVDEDWEDLQMMFSYTFRNRPYEYHNGGLWPMITGFYVADLARRQQPEEARRCLQAVHRANALEMDGEPWGFPEYVHGRELTPGGKRQLGWSAAAAVIGHHALQGRPVFGITGQAG